MPAVVIVGTDQQRFQQWQTDVQAVIAGADIRFLKNTSFGNDKPDLCLVDFDSLDQLWKKGLQVSIASRPETKFFILKAVPEALDGVTWVSAGAKGYANRLINSAVMQSAVKAVNSGEIWAGKLVVQHLLTGLQSARPVENNSKLGALTERERELANCVRNGMNNQQIAKQLNISERTVKVHLNNIFRKLNLSSRVQLAMVVEQDSRAESDTV